MSDTPDGCFCDTPDIESRGSTVVSQADITGTPWGGEVMLGNSMNDESEEPAYYEGHSQS